MEIIVKLELHQKLSTVWLKFSVIAAESFEEKKKNDLEAKSSSLKASFEATNSDDKQLKRPILGKILPLFFIYVYYETFLSFFTLLLLIGENVFGSLV